MLTLDSHQPTLSLVSRSPVTTGGQCVLFLTGVLQCVGRLRKNIKINISGRNLIIIVFFWTVFTMIVSQVIVGCTHSYNSGLCPQLQ